MLNDFIYFIKIMPLSYLVIIIISFLIIILYLSSVSNSSSRNFKNEIVSLGVLGTFIGIYIGLFYFDTSNIKDSIPLLLEGLKTAFITSVVGMFFSILISIQKPPKLSTITLDTIAKNQQEMIFTLNKALEEISKSANEEIINSLEKVVKQFNENLSEQFGQNFKELNSAIKNLNSWQDNYKNQIKSNEKALNNMLFKVEEILIQNNKQGKDFDIIISNLSKMSVDVSDSLNKSVTIVEESLQMLLREANGKL